MRNIKTLSKTDFELYSERVPIILDSIISHFEQSMAEKKEFESYREQLFQYTRNFIETGDLPAALKLLTQVHDTFESKLDNQTRLLLTAIIGHLFAALGMDDEAEHFYEESLKSSGVEIAPCFIFNMTTQAMISLHRKDFNLAVSTSKRALDYMGKAKSESPYISMLPMYGPELRQRLTHIHTIASIELASSEKAGSGKRKTIFENALAYSQSLNIGGRKRNRFFYLCQQALIYASMGYPTKSENALEKAFRVLNANQDFLTAHGYYFFAARAFHHSRRADFSDAYSDAKLAFRASFNTPDVFMELYVMEVFLDIAQKFSVSFPENRKNVSEFYMKGNSLLKQFVEFLEEKDWYTGKEHSSRVASLSYMIGKKLLTLFPYVQNQLDLQTLYLAAYVHDVGKLKLPWILINKIGKLTEYELSYIFRHVTFSRDILENLNFKDIARIVYQHHENMDGSGYPNGIRDISIAANIISLADSFEAMTSPFRKYKEQKTLVETRDELSAMEGQFYLPEVIKAFRMIDLEKVDTIPED
ncbi:MAG: hypothetical protein DRJ08_07770 [Acidobacteria bacterium]|nr:MAG: hypothetical protein DRJ14_05275 [Acidobacteriota bacterium]RLE19856.1 MAG: hypothetical protein DRJ08_07770 [Acidobacteriota bacterium]